MSIEKAETSRPNILALWRAGRIGVAAAESPFTPEEQRRIYQQTRNGALALVRTVFAVFATPRLAGPEISPLISDEFEGAETLVTAAQDMGVDLVKISFADATEPETVQRMREGLIAGLRSFDSYPITTDNGPVAFNSDEERNNYRAARRLHSSHLYIPRGVGGIVVADALESLHLPSSEPPVEQSPTSQPLFIDTPPL